MIKNALPIMLMGHTLGLSHDDLTETDDEVDDDADEDDDKGHESRH